VEIIEFEITEATEEDLDAIYDVDKKAFSYPMSRSSIERTYAIEGFPSTLWLAFFPLMR